MTDSSDTRLSMKEEVTANTVVTPFTNAMVWDLVSQSIQHQMPKAKSQIITANRDLRDNVRLSRSTLGDIVTELVHPTSGEAIYEAISSVMCDEVITAQVQVASCTITSGLSTVTAAGGLSAFAVGDLVRLSGATAAVDNRIGRVTLSADTTITLDLPDSAVWDTTSSGTVTVTRASYFVNGTDRRYWTFERAWLNQLAANQKYISWTGQVFNSMDVTIAIGAISRLAFSLFGYNGTTLTMASSTVGHSGGTYDYATAADSMDPTGVQEVVIDNVTYPGRSLSVRAFNNARVQEQFGTLGPVGIPVGQFEVTGSLSAYFAFVGPLLALEADSKVPLWFTSEDAAGNMIAFDIDQVTFDTVNVPTQGINQDEMIEMTFSGQESSVGSQTMRVYIF